MNPAINPSLLCLQGSCIFIHVSDSPESFILHHAPLLCLPINQRPPSPSVHLTTCSIRSISTLESLCLAIPFKRSFISLISNHFSADFVQSGQQVGPWTGTFRPGWDPLPWWEHFRRRNELDTACRHLTFLWHFRRPLSLLRTCTYL